MQHVEGPDSDLRQNRIYKVKQHEVAWMTMVYHSTHHDSALVKTKQNKFNSGTLNKVLGRRPSKEMFMTSSLRKLSGGNTS